MDANMLAPAGLELPETSVGVMVLCFVFFPPVLSECSSCNAPQLKIEEGNAGVGWMSHSKTMDGSTREGFPVITAL